MYVFQASDFKNIETIDVFLSSEERQAIIFHLLNSIRAQKGDAATESLKFRDGEAICKKWKKYRRNLFKVIYFNILLRICATASINHKNGFEIYFRLFCSAKKPQCKSYISNISSARSKCFATASEELDYQILGPAADW